MQAFFHGGLYSNDATTPVNGSHIEVMDLKTMSPYSIQVTQAACHVGGGGSRGSGSSSMAHMQDDSRMLVDSSSSSSSHVAAFLA